MTYEFPTPATASPYWRDMPGNEAEASLYLDTAAEQCLAYAPLTPPEDWDGTIPARYFLAIITQARNIANAGVAPVSGDDFDGSGYGVSTYPLDWAVKQMLRPEQALGAIV
jgi:hypothetical protein